MMKSNKESRINYTLIVCIALALILVMFSLFVENTYSLKCSGTDKISNITFIGFNLIQLITATHGYFVHDQVLMIGSIYSLLTCGVVSILIVYYFPILAVREP